MTGRAVDPEGIDEPARRAEDHVELLSESDSYDRSLAVAGVDTETAGGFEFDPDAGLDRSRTPFVDRPLSEGQPLSPGPPEWAHVGHHLRAGG